MFCFALVSPQFLLGGIGTNAWWEAQVPQPGKLSCNTWWLRKVGLRVTRESKGPLGAGGKSLPSSANRGTEFKRRGPDRWGGGRGFAWWCHEMILAWIIKESHLRIRHVAAREVKVHPTGGLLLKFIDSSRHQTPHSFAFPLPSTVRNPNV